MITFHISGLCSKSANVEPVGNETAALRDTLRILGCALFHSTLCFFMFSGAGRMGHKQQRMYKYSTVKLGIV